jgi:hypothetical protein
MEVLFDKAIAKLKDIIFITGKKVMRQIEVVQSVISVEGKHLVD